MHSIGDVAVFQPNPQIIWVGTGERANRQSVGWGDGVYKSTDAGKTWVNYGAAHEHAYRAHSIASHQSRHCVGRGAGKRVGTRW
ncbi:hypothetical protein [Gemmatimonas sp.]|uniref:hypothetical protein n=1 Tax=Gemmatimonas sp. TaxID=1962908 RepID=UPI003DA50DEF